MNPPGPRHFGATIFRLLSIGVFAGSISFLVGCQGEPAGPAGPAGTTGNASQSNGSAEQTATRKLSPLEKLISSEELILDLGNRLAPLNRSAMNLQVPFGEATSLFADDAMVVDLNEISESETVNDFLTVDHWSFQPVRQLDGKLWGRFFELVSYLETAKFYFISGDINEADRELDATMGFKSHLRFKDGSVGYANAKMKVVWELGASVTDVARVKKFQTKEFHCSRSPGKLFRDVSSEVFSDGKLAQAIADSEQENFTRKLLLGEPVKKKPDDEYKLFFPEVTLEHPAVSVVDLDADGFDDFFLSRTHLPSLMFRNRGDGSFEEIGGPSGLQFDYDCTCSLFADFDNDGDQDAFIGRARHRAVYLQNNDGKFSDCSDLVSDTELPYMVSSIAAADYDNDGLLDVYFSTYSPIEGSHAQVISAGNRWPKFFLDTIEQVEISERIAKALPYLNMAGPPNLLLKNKGDSFGVSDKNFDVESWRKSFQSAWCDFDQDGDQDLYVCNDFSPDDLFRNDGDSGFKRISDEVGLEKLGFGMGVSWQDHNNDGHFDLYVSNMYSKAGTRITKQIEGLDPRIEQMAKGNYLYEYDGERFELVSMEGPNHTVAVTGWSWGGQMTDLDNDGNLDIVVANGYYSAPKEVEIKIDL